MVWKVADRTIVGQVSIGRTPTAPVTPPITPPFTPPFTPPVTPPVTATFLADHKKIRAYLEKEGKKYLCPRIEEIVGKTGILADVVQLHIDVMSEDEAIAVVQKGVNPVVCSVDAMQRLVENLRKLR